MLIGDNYKIESDDLNVTIYERSTAKKGKFAGEDVWHSIGFYATLKAAIDALVDKEIKGTGLKDLQDVYKKIEQLKRDLFKEVENEKDTG